MIKSLNKIHVADALLAFIFCACIQAAFANTGGDSMPWTSALNTQKESITGPVAFVVSIIAIVACGCMLLFGGSEFSQFMKSAIYLTLVIGLIVGATNLLSTLFDVNGVTVGDLSNLSADDVKALMSL